MIFGERYTGHLPGIRYRQAGTVGFLRMSGPFFSSHLRTSMSSTKMSMEPPPWEPYEEAVRLPEETPRRPSVSRLGLTQKAVRDTVQPVASRERVRQLVPSDRLLL